MLAGAPGLDADGLFSSCSSVACCDISEEQDPAVTVEHESLVDSFFPLLSETGSGVCLSESSFSALGFLSAVSSRDGSLLMACS